MPLAPFFFTVCLLLSAACHGQAVDVASRSISLSLSTEPPSLNSLVSTNLISSFVLGHVMEGLLQYDQYNQLAAGVAERWELTETGARFWLRRDAKWSDGKPVTAHDFVFAWQKAIDPVTASQYAFILYPLKNAEQINKGQLAVEQLGVQAVDDYQLVVSFDRPCPYFLNLTAFMTYYPLREDIYQQAGQRYAADKEDLIYNGAFTLSEWVHGAKLTLKKNPYYWNNRAIALNTINIPYITGDPSATFNLFQDQQVVLAGLDRETVTQAMNKGYPLKRFHTGAQYFLEFNFRPGHISAQRPFRKAVQAIFDPKVLVNKVIATPANLPGESLFPITVKGLNGSFRDEYPAPQVDRSLALARSYITALKQSLGDKPLPPVVLLAGDNPRAAREAEYLQYLLQEGLGLTVKIDAQMFKQYLEKMRRGDFDIALAGWGPDFDDAITFGDLFASWNDNNRGRYQSDEYDRWVKLAQNSVDQAERMAAMNQLQMLIAKDVVIIPTFERGTVYVQHPQLKGVVRRLFGADPDFKFAHVVNPSVGVSKSSTNDSRKQQELLEKGGRE